MLSPSHNRAYQDFLILLTNFKSFLGNPEEKKANSQIQQKFQELQHWFDKNVTDLDEQELEKAIASRWQSVQTEIKREFKLLTTDILFLKSARQQSTQTKRIQSISDRVTKLIGYCQVMLANSG
ncbi:heterocyst frequency control protein PatD [Pleurocapsa sp. PCC 7319]|uniref:heterocyst frequency control protein PatD n=1 Tax=Pleurocapsa sp. PCC 7319 TaxID=118161 RepID=UPI000382E984|nr:heterocyst frequency control protein PatD [Pleurocapsa sp. PCC 7319]